MTLYSPIKRNECGVGTPLLVAGVETDPRDSGFIRSMQQVFE